MTTANDSTNARLLSLITSLSDDSALDEKAATLAALRSVDPRQAKAIDTLLITQLVNMRKGIQASQENHTKLEALLRSLTEPPLLPAIYLGTQNVLGVHHARVLIGSSQRIVNFGPDMQETNLGKGDEVFLNKELNVIIDKSPDGIPPFGETALFNRLTPDGVRMILDDRDREIVVDLAKPMQRRDDIERGDVIRFDRSTLMAYEKIERSDDRQDFLVKDLDDVSLASIGGQQDNLRILMEALTCGLVAPERAEAYGLRGRRAITLIGPPGTGKTLMARVAAAEIGKLIGQPCSFFAVKPSEFLSPWIGETERKIRECFEDLADAADSGVSILFLDEVEAIGRIRGGLGGNHSDRFLAALLAEIDGFKDRQDVAIIVASNRKDLLDPALYERLSEIEIEVGRPLAEGARAIFEIHLPADTPVCPNGSSASDTRAEIIETAVSRLYAPNSGNEICTIKFRDGTTRVVCARELMSGRLISQICLAARQSAFSREMRNRNPVVKDFEPGLNLTDMHDAVSATLTRMQTTLTRHNAHAYLADLPQDIDVVSVEPIRRKVSNAHEYITIS